MMKPLSAGLFTLAILFFISTQHPIQAQTNARAARAAAPFNYDAREEITLNGTVTRVVTKTAPSVIAGSHLLVTTSSGPVDASLGRFGLQGYGAVSVGVGQQIEATGVMRTIKDKPIFVVRSVNVDGKLYTIRDQHGVVLSPQARKRAGQKAGQAGESL
jgi:hypothetical protein